MAMAFGKIGVLVGAGIVGIVLTKERGVSDIANVFSGAFKGVRKYLEQDKDNSRSAKKPQTEIMLAEVNDIRLAIQRVASASSATILTWRDSASGTYGMIGILVAGVGVIGFGYTWWKGWKLSDMMFVTRIEFSKSCSEVADHSNRVSSNLSSTKKDISSRIDLVDNNLTQLVEHSAATKDNVSNLNGELSGFYAGVEYVRQAIRTLETKLARIERNQDFANEGVYDLCTFVRGLEQSRHTEHIQALSSNSSRPALEVSQAMPVAMTGSLPLLPLETSSRLATTEPLKVSRSTTLSASSLKLLQEVSCPGKARNSGPSISNVVLPEVRDGIPSMAASPGAGDGIALAEEPASNLSSLGRFGRKLTTSILARTRSTAS